MDLEGAKHRLAEIKIEQKQVIAARCELNKLGTKLRTEERSLLKDKIFQSQAIHEGEWEISVRIHEDNIVKYHLQCDIDQYATPTLWEIGGSLSKIPIVGLGGRDEFLDCEIAYKDEPWNDIEDRMMFCINHEHGISEYHFNCFVKTYKPKFYRKSVEDVQNKLRSIIEVIDMQCK